jgi:hypothetical protein
MSFTKIYSRTDLQGYREKIKRESLVNSIEYTFTTAVLQSAQQGKTSYFWEKPSRDSGVKTWPPPPVITDEDIVSALKEKFPDTTVEYQETWLDVRPGVKEQKKGILIDWS